jgi:hypothetical protein
MEAKTNTLLLKTGNRRAAQIVQIISARVLFSYLVELTELSALWQAF